MGDVVFDVGQRWMMDDRPAAVILTCRANAEYWADADKNWWSEAYLHHLGVLDAPAPKPGQRWGNDTPHDVQIVDADGELAAENFENGMLLCRGSVVDVAKWLAERKYRCVSAPCVACVKVENTGGAWGPHAGGAANVEISSGTFPLDFGVHPTVDGVVSAEREFCAALAKASGFVVLRSDGKRWHVEPAAPTGDIRSLAALASAVAEVWTPTTRETSRRYVDMAVASMEDRRFAGPIKATLVAFSDDQTDYGLRPVDIMAVIDACRTWEHGRAQLPFPNRKLTAAEATHLLEATHLAAYGRLSWHRAAVVAHLVADVYERARTACG